MSSLNPHNNFMGEGSFYPHCGVIALGLKYFACTADSWSWDPKTAHVSPVHTGGTGTTGLQAPEGWAQHP